MRSKSSTGKGMFASKAVNVALSVALVLGLSPATKAVAAGGASESTSPAAQQDAPADTQAVSSDQAPTGVAAASMASMAGETDAASAANATGAATAPTGADGDAGLSADAAAPAASNAAASESAGQTGSPAARNAAAASASSASIMPTAAGEYQEHAEYREVTTGISVAVYTDPELKNPVGSDPVAGDATLYGKGEHRLRLCRAAHAVLPERQIHVSEQRELQQQKRADAL